MSKLKNPAVCAVIFFLLSANLALAAGPRFDKNLYFGLRKDPDVVVLQDYLRTLGFFTLPTSTGNYLQLTTEAVKKFQTANGILPRSGFFGPLSRQAANRGLSEVGPPTSKVSGQATSTYQGRIKIDDISTYGDINNQYIRLRNESQQGDNISITGFKLVNSGGDEFVIPKGQNLPGFSALAQDDIILNQYDAAKIIIGRQEKQLNFRENLCTGYFDENSDFFNQLPHDCPRPDVRADLKLPDHCIQIFESAESCRTIDPSRIEVAECLDFSQAHFNYQGCVNDFKNRSDFYSDQWLIWMQRSTNFLRSIHDQITLYDRAGLVVDKYSY